MVGSKTPCVLGYVIMNAARSRACASDFARRSARSTSPSFKVATETTLNPAMTALAGLVPWADCGIRQTSRCASLRDLWYSRIARRPAYSPCEPAFGCNETPQEAGDFGEPFC